MTKEEYQQLLNKISVTSHATRIFITNLIFMGTLYFFGFKISPDFVISVMYYMIGWSIFLSYMSLNLKTYHLKSALASCLLSALVCGVKYFI